MTTADAEKLAAQVDKRAAQSEARTDAAVEGQVSHVRQEEAAEKGKAARRAVPRSSHAAWTPPLDRRSPVDILAEQATTREPDLVPIRHARMLESPFAFYRGAAALIAADLAHTPASGLRVQLCGDAHLLNFGGYASPERALVFDVNDFDETLSGPWEWDIKRLAASIEVAGREQKIAEPDRRRAVQETVRHYREAMGQFARLTELDVWYLRLDETGIAERFQAEVGKENAPQFARNLAKARAKDSMKAFTKLTEVVDGEPRIVADPPLIIPLRDLLDPVVRPDYEEEIRAIFRGYRQTLEGDRRHLLEQYRLVDAARKVVGVGSVGTRCWVVLLMGRNDNDPLFLQIKEAQESVLAPFAGKSEFANQGQRVVEGQRLMQAASDIFLGWIRATGLDGRPRDFYVRQLWDSKWSVDLTNLNPVTLTAYGRACAWTLARAHARSGDRFALAAYLGNGPRFDEAAAQFSTAYADQNQRDYDEFAAAVKRGTLEATAPPPGG